MRTVAELLPGGSHAGVQALKGLLEDFEGVMQVDVGVFLLCDVELALFFHQIK